MTEFHIMYTEKEQVTHIKIGEYKRKTHIFKTNTSTKLRKKLVYKLIWSKSIIAYLQI